MVSRWYNQKSVNSNTLVGKPSNWDFTTSRTSTSTITIWKTDLNKQDITLVEHIRNWEVISIYENGTTISLVVDIITITQKSIAFPVHEFLVDDTFIVYTTISRDSVTLENDEWDINVQNPLPSDGDSLYEKDIWVDTSITTDWVDLDDTWKSIVTIPFNNLHTRIQNTTTTNPKVIRIHLNRTINAQQVGLWSYWWGDFSNVKIILLGSWETEREVKDDSSNNTKYTSRNYEFEPQLFNAIRLEFYTADTITLSNITVQKAINVNSQIRGLRPDWTTWDVAVTNGNNLKVSLEEFETAFFDANPIPTSVVESAFNVEWDEIIPTFATLTDTYVYKLATVVVQTTTLTYTDSTKTVLASVTKT